MFLHMHKQGIQIDCILFLTNQCYYPHEYANKNFIYILNHENSLTAMSENILLHWFLAAFFLIA